MDHPKFRATCISIVLFTLRAYPNGICSVRSRVVTTRNLINAVVLLLALYFPRFWVLYFVPQVHGTNVMGSGEEQPIS